MISENELGNRYDKDGQQMDLKGDVATLFKNQTGPGSLHIRKMHDKVVAFYAAYKRHEAIKNENIALISALKEKLASSVGEGKEKDEKEIHKQEKEAPIAESQEETEETLTSLLTKFGNIELKLDRLYAEREAEEIKLFDVIDTFTSEWITEIDKHVDGIIDAVESAAKEFFSKGDHEHGNECGRMCTKMREIQKAREVQHGDRAALAGTKILDPASAGTQDLMHSATCFKGFITSA